ncbi:MAG: hypothetical protein H7A23_10635 [Leptospiraceae bacterium]|nr:hypothetical protein [Leptospiraceae bacterium]MCP5495001.1 hypothetical protein [Leptospiraceae bacterium]
MTQNKVMIIISTFLFLGFASSSFAQFSFDDLKKLKDKTGSSDSGKKGGNIFDQAQDLQAATQKNEKSKSEFTGGEKVSIALTVKELESDPAPASKKVLIIAGGLDNKYTVFNGDKEYAIYRYKNMPPSAVSVQFALKKELKKELSQKYKKGKPLESGFYEIIGKQSLPQLTMDQSQTIIIQKVELKP